MSGLIQLTVYGLANGAVLALAAVGFVLIYKASGVVNFAQGEFLLFGAYAFYTGRVLLQLPLLLAAGFALLVAIALGLGIERLILRRLVGEKPISLVMVSIGLAAILRAGLQLAFGTTPRPMPRLLPPGSVTLAGAAVPLDRLLAVLVSAFVLLAFSALLRWSRHGVVMRAMADDQRAALAQGISVRRVLGLSWSLAAVSAAIGGTLLADITEVSQNLGGFGIMVFPVVILGGLDSVPGTIVGALGIGLCSQYAESVWPGASQIASHLSLVVLLALRPYGLFGEPRIERV